MVRATTRLMFWPMVAWIARQDCERLLKALDFLLPLRLPLAVGHHLAFALRLELVEIHENRVKLLASRGFVLLVVVEGNLELRHLVLLPLRVTKLRCLRHGVVLRQLLVSLRLGGLVRFRFRKQSREVRLRYLKD